MGGGPPTSMSSAGMGSAQGAGAAGPASGKYGGFGSEDIARLGYNNENKFSAPYDPYTKGQSAPSQNTFSVANSTTAAAASTSTKAVDKKKSKKSKKSKKKAKDSYDSESDGDSDSDEDSDDSSDSEDRKKKAKRNKKK